MTYENDIRNDIITAIGVLRSNNSISSDSIDFIINAATEKLNGELVPKSSYD